MTSVTHLYSDDADDVGNLGYAFGAFPAGRLSVGSSTVQAVSDSDAFTGLRGVANRAVPLGPNPGYDAPNKDPGGLVDEFNNGNLLLASTTSLLPPGPRGGMNRKNVELGEGIMRQFDVGSSTFNSLPDAAGPYGNDLYFNGLADNGRAPFSGTHTNSLPAQFREAGARSAMDDLPLTPFQSARFNFGNATGEVDVGANIHDTTLHGQEGAILQAMHATIPATELSGTKADLMPVFSEMNQVAVEQRPILQGNGKRKNTLWLGGVVDLPDDLAIDPSAALMAESSIPANIPQTLGEVSAALNIMGNTGSTAMKRSVFGAPLQAVRTLAGTEFRTDDRMYAYDTTGSNEPLMFGDREVMEYIYGRGDVSQK